MDTEATVAEARRLWRAVGRDNLMVKVPATKAGLPAIRQLIGEGININITLLFSQHVYEDVVEAYLAGLEHLVAQGGDASKIASVASVFVSRIDVAVDKLIERRLGQTDDIGAPALTGFRGKVAIANSKLAYQRYKNCSSGVALGEAERQGRAGAAPALGQHRHEEQGLQRRALCRGADCSRYGQHHSSRNHGRVPRPRQSATEPRGKYRRGQGGDGDAGRVRHIDRRGDGEVVEEGVQLFADAFDKLLGAVARKRAVNLGEKLDGQTYKLSPELEKVVVASLESWRHAGNVRRLWAGDAGLWTGSDEAKWLGWLDIAEEQRDASAPLEFSRGCAKAKLLPHCSAWYGGIEPRSGGVRRDVRTPTRPFPSFWCSTRPTRHRSGRSRADRPC